MGMCRHSHLLHTIRAQPPRAVSVVHTISTQWTLCSMRNISGVTVVVQNSILDVLGNQSRTSLYARRH